MFRPEMIVEISKVALPETNNVPDKTVSLSGPMAGDNTEDRAILAVARQCGSERAQRRFGNLRSTLIEHRKAGEPLINADRGLRALLIEDRKGKTLNRLDSYRNRPSDAASSIMEIEPLRGKSKVVACAGRATSAPRTVNDIKATSIKRHISHSARPGPYMFFFRSFPVGAGKGDAR